MAERLAGRGRGLAGMQLGLTPAGRLYVFGVGLPELALIALVAVIVFGPDKLPELAKQAGAMLRKARQFANAARDELRNELGPEYSDLELRDLDPRTIVRKHIVEAMEDDAEEEARPKRARPAPPGGGGGSAVRRRGDVELSCSSRLAPRPAWRTGTAAASRPRRRPPRSPGRPG